MTSISRSGGGVLSCKARQAILEYRSIGWAGTHEEAFQRAHRIVGAVQTCLARRSLPDQPFHSLYLDHTEWAAMQEWELLGSAGVYDHILGLADAIAESLIRWIDLLYESFPVFAMNGDRVWSYPVPMTRLDNICRAMRVPFSLRRGYSLTPAMARLVSRLRHAGYDGREFSLIPPSEAVLCPAG